MELSSCKWGLSVALGQDQIQLTISRLVASYDMQEIEWTNSFHVPQPIGDHKHRRSRIWRSRENKPLYGIIVYKHDSNVHKYR